MNKIKVAVVGAAGQVGSVLIRQMLEFPNITPVAVCRNDMSAGLINFYSPGAEIRSGSITELDSAKQLISDCDVIINCALASVKGSPKKSLLLNKSMIDSFCDLDNIKLVIHLSSVSVYGACIDSGGSRENTFEHPHPDSDYGRSKLYIDNYAKRKFLLKKLNHYILRLGHVYGARMDRSRQIIELANDPCFSLPFNGDLPSNSIHVEHLAGTIIALISNPLPSGIYNVANKHQSWRQMFDWHTKVTGLPSVKSMSKDISSSLRMRYLSRSIINDIVNWLRALPILSLIRYPAIFDYTFRILSFVPPNVINRLANIYKRLDVKRQIASETRNSKSTVAPVYFSDAMPGQYLKLPPDVPARYPSSEVLSNDLSTWYERFSNSIWLLDSINKSN